MMRKSAVNISIIIILFLLINTANGDVCISDDVIKCNSSTSNVECTIYQNNIAIISQAISLCSAGSFTELYIYIDSGLQSITINITLNLANNILSLKVYGLATSQPVYIISTQTHPSVSRIKLEDLFIYNSGVFYAKFPSVTYFYADSVYLDTDLNFSTLKKLTFIHIVSFGQSNRNTTMDKEWVGGLSRLQYLRLYNCEIQNITTDAFENLTSLTALNLGGNNILELAPEVFRDLTALKRLLIISNRNDIQIPKDSENNNAFSPLKHLTYLYLTYTKIIPFDAFSTIGSIQALNLPQISTRIVPSTPFQHLHNLKLLAFGGIFPMCNCSMQWASIVGKFGISVNGWCRDNRDRAVTNSSLYTECGLTESYQCFNKTVACKYTCINTPDSYICACDAGYGLSLTETESTCNDIDECLANKSPCKQKCRNTLGSYQCYCDSGYKLSVDQGEQSFICQDINECALNSNLCSQQCINTNGSYYCDCDEEYRLDPTNVSVCLAIYYQSNMSNGQFVSKQSFNNSATNYYNGTFIGVTVLLVIIIIILILLLLTSLFIIIYMCYNKRNTIVQFQQLPYNNQKDLASPEENSVPYYSEMAPETTYYNMPPRLNINVSPNLENIEDLM